LSRIFIPFCFANGFGEFAYNKHINLKEEVSLLYQTTSPTRTAKTDRSSKRFESNFSEQFRSYGLPIERILDLGYNQVVCDYYAVIHYRIKEREEVWYMPGKAVHEYVDRFLEAYYLPTSFVRERGLPIRISGTDSDVWLRERLDIRDFLMRLSQT